MSQMRRLGRVFDISDYWEHVHPPATPHQVDPVSRLGATLCRTCLKPIRRTPRKSGGPL